MSETTLSTAVQSERLATKQGFLQKLFAVWFDAFVYNQIWEDPRVDLKALDLDSDSRVLTISSGGCNALNYLLARPASVTAVDLNRNHIYLLNLKLAAVRHLPSYEDLFTFFGRGKGPNTGVLYQRFLAPNLDRAARDFWESNTFGGSLIYGSRISFFRDGGLYDHSRNGYFLRFFHGLAHRFGLRPELITHAASREEQIEIFERHIDPFFDNFIIRFVGKLPVTTFGLGIPPQQYAELTRDLSDGRSIIDLYRERVRKLACEFPIEENYFAWQAFARRYDTERRVAVPDYLKEENFDLLRAESHKLTTVVGSATDVIKNSPAGAFNRFVLLDAQDWMTGEQMTGLWRALAEKAGPGSRIIFRTAGSSSPIETVLPKDLRPRFRYEKEKSVELFKQDRSSIYGGFHLYRSEFKL